VSNATGETADSASHRGLGVTLNDLVRNL